VSQGKTGTHYSLLMDNCLSALKGVEKLALHSCCGPCSSACIVRLASHFEITVFYYNPNIDTLDEYTHRAGEQRRLIAEMPTPNPVQFVDACYTPAEFEAVANPFGAEQEGGSRCTACYALRLERTAIFAREREIPWMCSTLSVSPMKDAVRINEIGNRVAEKHGIKWLWSDFKKQNGYQQSIALSREYGLYRQDYCGCRWSRQARCEQVRQKLSDDCTDRHM